MLRTLPLIVLTLISSVAIAGDHEQAQQLQQSGEILPLETLLDTALEKVPGKVIEVELDREHGEMIYEIEILTAQKRVIEVKLNARTGQLISQEQED